MADSSVPITAGTGTNIDTVTTSNGDHRQVVVIGDRGGYEGRAASFIMPGRAGTTGQRLFSIHNATGSTVAVDVKKVTVDVASTAAKVVIPPVIRLWKITALPTGGTAVTKVAVNSGSGSSSSASVTLLQDASSDRTSGTAISATLPAGTIVTQEWAPRVLTLVGYEAADRIEFFGADGETLTLRALEGLVVFLDYTVATSNPITDMWTVGVHWEEYVP